MGIQSTRYITRETAIHRIIEIKTMVKGKRYRDLTELCDSECQDVQYFVENDDMPDLDEEGFDQYTDKMLGDLMDRPFYRFSYFDNYLVQDDHEDD